MRVVLLAILLAGAAAAGVWWWLQTPLPLARPVVELSIEPGTPPREVAQAWVGAGIEVDARLLYAWFRASGQARKIRAGSYEVHGGITPRDLLDKMVRGDETLETVRFIEGWTFKQLRAALAKAPGLGATTANMSDAEVMQRLGSPDLPAEGNFYPDTYAYSRGVSDLTVLKRAHQTLRRHLDAAWAARAPDLPLQSPEQALVLASIIEKETGRSADRSKIAAVFINRLRLGMPLQTDPSVIYGLSEAFDGNLRKRDLSADTPFNTYLRPGLPPTPIAMPGRESLHAALHPAAVNALYFVARGDGTSEFSDNLAAHNRAVNLYQRGK
ncbi:MAG TPA: endolytic transglycosylase MltG [Burkholderiaceae bacterium]